MFFITDFLIFVSGIITGLIDSTGYWGVFLTMVLESAGLPVPSEIIMPFAGYFVFLGKMDFLTVVLIGTLGNLAGGIILYYVGLKGGRPLLEKYGKYALIRKKELDTADRWFSRFGTKIILAGRMLPVVRTFISLPAGTAKMDFKKFVAYTVMGSIPWNAAMVCLGMALGSNWSSLEGTLSFLNYAVAAGLLLLAAYAAIKIRKRRIKARNSR